MFQLSIFFFAVKNLNSQFGLHQVPNYIYFFSTYYAHILASILLVIPGSGSVKSRHHLMTKLFYF
jgi:hypothetical protein